MTSPSPATPPIAAELSPVVDAPAAPASVGKPPLSGMALASLVIGAFELFVLLIVRIVAAIASQANDGAPVLALTLGIFGLVALLPTVAAIVLGHIAIVQTVRGRRRGLGLASLGTGLGYVNLLFWGNRVLIAIIVAVQAGDLSQFVPDNFWWA